MVFVDICWVRIVCMVNFVLLIVWGMCCLGVLFIIVCRFGLVFSVLMIVLGLVLRFSSCW